MTFALTGFIPDADRSRLLTETEVDQLFAQTVEYWRGWLSKCSYKGRWREMVERSALVLKLLTFEPTGAIIAAPTCSLPETLGGERNWDYRYRSRLSHRNRGRPTIRQDCRVLEVGCQSVVTRVDLREMVELFGNWC